MSQVSDTHDYPCRESEKCFLEEFNDLFPEDIPAVSDETEEGGLICDGSFPEKLQNENSMVRHKIVLTDPSVIID